ncbi:MAG: hypothetical protein KAJ42_03410 [Gemmatimonadetes bacterium]|nr:hypothetical protein [Gemmatimonadota bacterium]
MHGKIDTNGAGSNTGANTGAGNSIANPDLKKLERAVWIRCYEDGLIDVFLGILLLLMGSGHILTESYGMSERDCIVAMVILQIVAVVAIVVAKRILTYPRIGRVKFGPKGKSRYTKTVILLTGSAVVGLVAFLVAMASRSGGLGGLNADVLLPVIYVLNMVLVFGLFAWISGVTRFFLVGVLFALPLPLAIGFKELAGIRIGYTSFAVPGALIILMGFVVLSRFLRKYPPLREEY